MTFADKAQGSRDKVHAEVREPNNLGHLSSKRKVVNPQPLNLGRQVFNKPKVRAEPIKVRLKRKAQEHLFSRQEHQGRVIAAAMLSRLKVLVRHRFKAQRQDDRPEALFEQLQVKVRGIRSRHRALEQARFKAQGQIGNPVSVQGLKIRVLPPDQAV